MKAFEDLLSGIAWIGIAVFALLLAIRVISLWRTRRQRRGLRHAPGWVASACVAAVLGLGLLGYGLIAYLFVLQRGSAFMPEPLKLVLAGVLLVWLATSVVAHLWPRLPVGRWTMGFRIAGAVLSCALGTLLALSFWNAARYPTEGHALLLQPPFEGEWVATGAGASASTNHHHRIASQRYAIDIAKACEDGRLFRGEGAALEDSCTFGAAVLSPVDGVVAHVVDGLPDRDSRQELAGNHVIIRLDEGRYVALAHLQQGSVSVAPGEAVRMGQPVGRAGNSGNSDFPHLHIHVQDSAVYDLRESRSIPFRFTNAQVKRYLFWRQPDSVALLANDRIRKRGK